MPKQKIVVALSVPWVTEDEYISWIGENHEEIGRMCVDENLFDSRRGGGGKVLPPQPDELIVLSVSSGYLKSDFPKEKKKILYYYWIYGLGDEQQGKPSQYLIRSDDYGEERFKRGRKMGLRSPHVSKAWRDPAFLNSRKGGLWRIKLDRINNKVSFLNYNELPWGDVK
tara:strand:+ start:234 stop:740 length:507 start_codon:yes stop_codon:yes gene_type:complete